MAPENASNTLLRQVLFAIQNQTQPSPSPGHFDSSGNIQIYDPVNDAWLSLTAPNGILTLN